MPMAPRSSLAGVGGCAAALASCALPSADISTTQTPAASTESRSKAKPQRRSLARGHRPTVIDAELLPDGKHLRLHLSEPITPTEGVNPNDFRLSMAMAYAYKLYAYATYYDIGEISETGELLNMRSLVGQGDTLELEFDQFVDPVYCAELERSVEELHREPGVRADAGMFLHYAPGERAIVDSEGNAMAAIAAEWVLRKRRGGDDAYEMYAEGLPARRALREPIRVRCGPELPPGPR
jgi:hypothetical protein